jgi:hypothetical protein
MKKCAIIIGALFWLSSSSAQSNSNSGIAFKKNEFRIDVLQAIAYGKIGLSYERFFERNFSVGVNANFSNSHKIEADFNNGFRNNIPRYEFNPYLRYALSKSKSRFYFAEVFGSVNGGDFKEIVYSSSKNTSVAVGGIGVNSSIPIFVSVGIGSTEFFENDSRDI